jgi:hypothetical protein
VLPAALDTPIYSHAGNFLGKRDRSIMPVYRVERAARAIVRLAARPRREIVIGGLGWLIAAGARLAPGTLEAAIARFGPSLQFEDVPAASSPGNIEANSGEVPATYGGWREYWRGRLHASRA